MHSIETELSDNQSQDDKNHAIVDAGQSEMDLKCIECNTVFNSPRAHLLSLLHAAECAVKRKAIQKSDTNDETDKLANANLVKVEFPKKESKPRSKSDYVKLPIPDVLKKFIRFSSPEFKTEGELLEPYQCQICDLLLKNMKVAFIHIQKHNAFKQEKSKLFSSNKKQTARKSTNNFTPTISTSTQKAQETVKKLRRFQSLSDDIPKTAQAQSNHNMSKTTEQKLGQTPNKVDELNKINTSLKSISPSIVGRPAEGANYEQENAMPAEHIIARSDEQNVDNVARKASKGAENCADNNNPVINSLGEDQQITDNSNMDGEELEINTHSQKNDQEIDEANKGVNKIVEKLGHDIDYQENVTSEPTPTQISSNSKEVGESNSKNKDEKNSNPTPGNRLYTDPIIQQNIEQPSKSPTQKEQPSTSKLIRESSGKKKQLDTSSKITSHKEKTFPKIKLAQQKCKSKKSKNQKVDRAKVNGKTNEKSHQKKSNKEVIQTTTTRPKAKDHPTEVLPDIHSTNKSSNAAKSSWMDQCNYNSTLTLKTSRTATRKTSLDDVIKDVGPRVSLKRHNSSPDGSDKRKTARKSIRSRQNITPQLSNIATTSCDQAANNESGKSTSTLATEAVTLESAVERFMLPADQTSSNVKQNQMVLKKKPTARKSTK